ncbi:MAG: DUF6049 family protein [Micrococcaceae bacterium]
MKKIVATLVLFMGLFASFSFLTLETKADTNNNYQLSFVEISPASIEQNSKVEVKASIKNTSQTTQSDLHMNLRLNPRLLVSRTQVQNWAQGDQQGNVPLDSEDVASLSPNQSATVEFQISQNALDPLFEDWGTRGISLDVTQGDSSDYQALISSFIVLDAPDQYQPTMLVPIVPITSTLSGTTPAGQIPNEDSSFAKNNQFANLLQVAQNNPISIASDPTVAATAEASTNADAKTWLDAYKKIPNEIINLPAFAPDVMAATRASEEENTNYQDFLNKIKDVAPADSRGINNIIWPSNSAVDPELLDSIATENDTFLIDSQNFDPRNDIVFTPDALTTVGDNNYKTVVVDHEFSTLLNSLDPAGDLTQLQQQFLAETATITRELPNTPRHIVFTTSPAWNPNPDMVKKLMTTLQSVPWIKFSNLQDVLDGTANANYGTLNYTDEQKQQELNPSLIQQSNEIRNKLLDFSKTVASTSTVGQQGSTALAQVASGSLRPNTDQQQALFDSWKNTSDEILNSVEIVQTSNLNLLTNNADVKFVVINKYNQAINIKIEAAVSNTKLKVDQPPSLTVEAHRQANVSIPLTAVGTGSTVLTLTPESLDNQPVGKSVEIPVSLNSQWGNIVTKIIISLSTLLILVGLIRTVRKNIKNGKPREKASTKF